MQKNHNEETEEPKLVLTKMEATNLYDGAEINHQVIETLLGGELNKVWDAVIPNPGDKVIVKGSSVLKIVFGGYNPNSKTRADVDIIVDNENIVKSLGERFDKSHAGRLATTLELETTNVGIVSSEKIKAENIKACDELAATVETLGIAHHPDISGKTYAERIGITKDNIIKAGNAELLTYDSTFPYETIAIELQRDENGQLAAKLIDRQFYLEQIRPAMEAQEKAGRYVGAMVFSPNVNSVQEMYLEVLSAIPPNAPPLEFTTSVPLWAINAIARDVKAACELDIELYGDGFFPNGNADCFYTLLAVNANRLANGENLFRVTKPTGEIVNCAEYFKQVYQTAIARGCFSNTTLGLDYAVENLRTAAILTKDVAEIYDSFYKWYPPSMAMVAGLLDHKAEELPLEVVLPYRSVLLTHGLSVTVPDLPGIRTKLNYYEIIKERFGGVNVPMTDTEHDNNQLNFFAAVRPPYSMSEVMAVLCVSMGWDENNDIEKINKIVRNWYPTGKLNMAWKIYDRDYDMGLDTSEIIKYMTDIKKGREKDDRV